MDPSRVASARTFLITGGAGFFGSLLKASLLADGHACVSIDLQRDDAVHPRLQSIQGDIRDESLLDHIFSEHRFDAVFHCAAMLAHEAKDKDMLWTSNVDGTRLIAERVKRHGVPRLVFISTNCLWGRDLGHPVTEEDAPEPIEVYGRSKWEAEKILRSHFDDFHCVIIRCPTIIDEGRLGLLSILFEFIAEGRKVWVVDGGKNSYQFVYAADLIAACKKSLAFQGSDVFNIGSDDVRPMRDVYGHVIAKAGTGARVANMPGWFILPLMILAHTLGLSPLGPYQYRMISQSFMFDTSKIKRSLGWRPTLTNGEMLWKAYEYYHRNIANLKRTATLSAHKQPARMGAIRVLKWLS